MAKKTEMVVPLTVCSMLLSIVSLPPRFSVSCLTIHKPIPVPRFPFVVKKGSKTLSKWSFWIPIPLSLKFTSTPSGSRHLLLRMRRIPPSGIASMAFATMFGENLEKFSSTCNNRRRVCEVTIRGDFCRSKFTLIEGEHVFDQILKDHGSWCAIIAGSSRESGRRSAQSRNDQSAYLPESWPGCRLPLAATSRVSGGGAGITMPMATLLKLESVHLCEDFL